MNDSLVVRTLGLLATGTALSLASAACSSAPTAGNAATAGSAVSEMTLELGDVTAVLAKLDGIRNGAPIHTDYGDGERMEACWIGPGGAKLSDLRKAFYCAMPLEFRLCNTMVLVSTDASKLDERRAGYFDCQKNVDHLFGSRGLFVFGADVDEMYDKLFLQGATLQPADDATVVAANRPALSGRAFEPLFKSCLETWHDESVDFNLCRRFEAPTPHLAPNLIGLKVLYCVGSGLGAASRFDTFRNHGGGAPY